MNRQYKTTPVKSIIARNKKVKIIIERSDDSYTFYAQNVPGIYGHGNTVEAAKQSALKGMEILKKYKPDEIIQAIHSTARAPILSII